MKNIKNVVIAAGAVLALLAVGLVPPASATGAQSDYNLNDTWLLSWGTQKAALYGSSPSNWVRVWVNGADHSAFTTTGLGIGTDVPVSKLDVVGGVSVGSYAAVTAAPANGMIVSGVFAAGTAAPIATNAFEAGSTSAVRIKGNGWLEFHQNQVPTVSCGTGNIIPLGNDQAGDVTVGAAATSCTITFAEAPTNIPSCWCSDLTSKMPCLAQPTATTVAMVGTGTTIAQGDILRWGCVGYQ